MGKIRAIKTMAIVAVAIALAADLAALGGAGAPAFASDRLPAAAIGSGSGEGGAGMAEMADRENISRKEGFSVSELPPDVIRAMKGASYAEDAAIPLGDLRFVRVLHMGFDQRVHQGELVVHSAVAEEVLEIFAELYEAGYPIEKIHLIDAYGADDDASMADNNTSAFCWRPVTGGGALSAHALGLAIDINPLMNPYVRAMEDGSTQVLPPEGALYLDRDAALPGMIRTGDPCWKAFVGRGWTWGGDWADIKDYQHFSKNGS